MATIKETCRIKLKYLFDLIETNNTNCLNEATVEQLEEMLAYFDAIKRPCRTELLEWIKKAVEKCEENDKNRHFILNLAILLISKEEFFKYLNSSNFYDKLFRLSSNRFIRLLESAVSHPAGVDFIIKSSIWENCLPLLHNTNQNMVDASLRLICKVLANANNDFYDILAKKVMDTSIINRILLHFLSESNDLRIPTEIIRCIRIDNLKHNESKMQLICIMQFIVEQNCAGTISETLTNFVETIRKHTRFEQVISSCAFAIRFWSTITKIIDVQRIEAEKCIQSSIIICLVPLFAVSFAYCTKEIAWNDLISNNDARSTFIHAMFKTLRPDMVYIFYKWRDPLTIDPNFMAITTNALRKLEEIRTFIDRQGATIITQSVLYILKDIVDVVKVQAEVLTHFLVHSDVMVVMLETLVIFFQEYDITWRENVETFNVTELVFDLLVIDALPVDVVVASLRLLRVSIVKQMSPNLALLVDSPDSSICRLGVLVRRNIDAVGDVRVELVRIIEALTTKKFPSLQKVIMEAELPSLVVTMSINDGESFVRATAIKCLQEMIQVDDIWTESLKDENLTKKMQKVLCTETEAIVRVEAATFMCKAYENGKILTEELDSLYSSMSHASTMDLHWEVKVRALDFWDRVIKSHLENQGMIDGCFPSVTFSKENRKIVTLTDNEIRKRLCKVLTQLSRIGCLGVLMAAIRDDCDVEVSKKAVSIAKPLLVLLKRHNVEMAEPTYDRSVSLSSGVSVEEGPGGGGGDFNQDDIIDQIVNAKDVSLLQGVYAGSDYGGSLCSEEAVRETRRVVQPNEFLELNENELEKAVQDKNKWLNGIEDLDSLLDDMLKSYEAGEVNVMDCY